MQQWVPMVNVSIYLLILCSGRILQLEVPYNAPSQEKGEGRSNGLRDNLVGVLPIVCENCIKINADSSYLFLHK